MQPAHGARQRDDAIDGAVAPPGLDLHLVERVPTCQPSDRVADIREALVEADHESVDDIAVCDDGRLRGLIPLRRLLAAGGDEQASTLMDPDPPVVGAQPGDFEPAAWKAVHHGESSLAVVDPDGILRGLVPPARLLSLLLETHDQDFARLRAYLASTQEARRAAEEAVGRRLRHRFWWLVLGLAGAALSAWIVGRFETRIATDIRLAFFIPGVVYLADAVGTQTEAVMVRGLSVGAPGRVALRLEALTGPAMGLVLALLSFPAIWLALRDPAIAAAVSIALLAACSVATVVAAAIPLALARTGRDPAFASGPLATVVQDLLSLVIYFLVAVLVQGAW